MHMKMKRSGLEKEPEQLLRLYSDALSSMVVMARQAYGPTSVLRTKCISGQRHKNMQPYERRRHVVDQFSPARPHTCSCEASLGETSNVSRPRRQEWFGGGLLQATGRCICRVLE